MGTTARSGKLRVACFSAVSGPLRHSILSLPTPVSAYWERENGFLSSSPSLLPAQFDTAARRLRSSRSPSITHALLSRFPSHIRHALSSPIILRSSVMLVPVTLTSCLPALLIIPNTTIQPGRSPLPRVEGEGCLALPLLDPRTR
jgi:hypothetical protein